MVNTNKNLSNWFLIILLARNNHPILLKMIITNVDSFKESIRSNPVNRKMALIGPEIINKSESAKLYLYG